MDKKTLSVWNHQSLGMTIASTFTLWNVRNVAKNTVQTALMFSRENVRIVREDALGFRFLVFE